MEVCIVTKRSFLSCSTTQRQNHGAFNFTSLNDAILQLPRLSVYALCGYIQRWSHVWLPVAVSVFATFGCLNWIFGKRISAYILRWISLQNKFFSSFLSGAATCCSHYWRAGASQLYRTTGTIFLFYICLYIYHGRCHTANLLRFSKSTQLTIFHKTSPPCVA